MAFLRIEDFDLWYEIHGTGEPLVLIPGFAAGAWLWFRQIEELARSFRVITFDPRGVSRSFLKSSTPVSIAAIADDVSALLDHLGIARANIAGTSFGGFVAQEFALRHPERTEKLILACTSFGGSGHIAPAPEVMAAFSAHGDLNSADRISKYMRPAFTGEFLAADPQTVEDVCRLREQNPVPESVYLQQLVAATTFEAESRCSAINAKTLIITGDKDNVVPQENSLNLKRVISNSRLEVVPNGGHLFFIENAALFNKLIFEFISRK